MQKKFLRTSALLILITLIALLLPFAFQYCADPPAYIPTAKDVEPEDALYILRAVDDHLIVTTKDGKTVQITNIDPRTLPTPDQRALVSGIPIDNSTALEEILQDFS